MINCDVVTASEESMGVVFTFVSVVVVERIVLVVVAITVGVFVVSVSAPDMGGSVVASSAEVISEVPVVSLVTLGTIRSLVVTVVDTIPMMPVVVATAAAAVLGIIAVVIFATVEPVVLGVTVVASTVLVAANDVTNVEVCSETFTNEYQHEEDW